MGIGASLISPGKKRQQQVKAAKTLVEPAPAVSHEVGVSRKHTVEERIPIIEEEHNPGGSSKHPEPELEDDDHGHTFEGGEELLPFEGNPIEFLASHAGTDPYCDYSMALALEIEQDFLNASHLFSLLRAHPSLGLSAHYHLAVCLLLAHPSTEMNEWGSERKIQDEALRCLEYVEANGGGTEDAECGYIQRNSKELLAHVLVTRREFVRALGLFSEIYPTNRECIHPNNQNTAELDGGVARLLDTFNYARCLHASGDETAALAILDQIDWKAARVVLPLVAADAVGITGALAISLDQV